MKRLSVCLLLAKELQTVKVFNKKKSKGPMIFASTVPGEVDDGQPPPATGSTAFYWCHEKTEAALHRPIKLYQQLAGCPPQPCSLSLRLPLCVSPAQSVPLSVRLSLKHAPFTSFGGTMAPQRELLRPLTPSPATNIYCAALIYSGLISGT